MTHLRIGFRSLGSTHGEVGLQRINQETNTRIKASKTKPENKESCGGKGLRGVTAKQARVSHANKNKGLAAKAQSPRQRTTGCKN